MRRTDLRTRSGPTTAWAETGIRHLAETWRSHPDNPRPHPALLDHWAALLDWWIHESELPLVIRNGSTGRRGSIAELRRQTVLFVDNSPPQWLYARAVFDGWMPSRDELADSVRAHMPVAFTLTATEKATATFDTSLHQGPNTSELGFSLHHIERVSVRRIRPEKLSAAELRDTTRRLLSLTNMFVLPKELSGLGELEQFIDVMRHDPGR